MDRSMVASEQQKNTASGWWVFPDSQDLGYFTAVVGVGLTLYGIGTVGYPHVVVPTLFLVAGMILAERGVTLWIKGRAEPALEGEVMDMGGGFFPGMPDHMMMGGAQNPDVARVLEVVQATWEDALTPEWDKWEINDDGVLVSYAFRSSEPGFFTDDGVKTRVVNKLVNAVEATIGSWDAQFDPKTDMIVVSQKSSFPTMALPPTWPVVHSESEARAFYPKFEYAIGVDKDGQKIKFAPGAGFPHAGIFGTTGGGKSVMTRGVLEQFRAAGFQLFLCDGKGTDYTSMMTQNNVVAVASTLQEQIAVVHMVRMIMNKRRIDGAKKAKAGDATWRDQQTPLLLVLDEFATTSNDMQAAYPKSYKAFMQDIAAILKVGREMRCHIFVCTQDMRASTVPSDWLNNMAVSICMGKPDNMTINKGFPSAVHGEAKLKGDTISKRTRGRGIVAITTEKGVTCELFQSYYSYSPAEDITAQSSDVQRSWMDFKQRVTDVIPRLYSRMWFIPEYPEPEEGEKDKYATQREKVAKESANVDLTELDVLDIHRLKPVLLENRNGPIPDHFKYDPLRDEYIAGENVDDGFDIDATL